jgi:uncharacterized lipoprotein YddW (UPF0748 family)
MRIPTVFPLLFALTIGRAAGAQNPLPADPQSPPPVQRELRAAWVATVGNIDWPSRPGLDSWTQQAELLAILNKAVALNLNAIIFQIRPGTDAFYSSPLEPWSEYLTGRQGRPPEPTWDPLAFAVVEAHKRGLELHAWFNPYRARYARPLGEAARTHVSNTQPALVRQYGSYLWMDPGELAVRKKAVQIVLDVVRRYDIDGVHIDDYFYPYKENDASGKPIDFPDSATYARYRRSGGKLSRDDWRRHNVDLLVEELYHGVHATKPWVRFGVSPIGIWRPGNPPSLVTGFDAYQEIYADTRKWLREGWVDYWVPQLYWAIDSPQSYPVLLDWWASQNVKHRNLWIGNGLHRVGDNSSVSAAGTRTANWRADEIIQQVRLTRNSTTTAPNGGATGNVFFSMKGLMRDVDSIDAKLAPLYAEPALVPASSWLEHTPPLRPIATFVRSSATGEPYVRLTPGGKKAPWLWVVRTLQGGQWKTEILPNEDRLHRLGALGTGEVERVVVNAVDRVGNLSAPTTLHLPR